MLTHENFVPELLKAVPALLPLYDDHLRDNDELLPHVFFGEVTRFVEAEHSKFCRTAHTNDEHLRNAQNIIALLEAAIVSGDADLENLIGASFVESLDRDNPNYLHLRALFGPALRNECNHWDRE